MTYLISLVHSEFKNVHNLILGAKAADIFENESKEEKNLTLPFSKKKHAF
jgi:hypothetical protein